MPHGESGPVDIVGVEGGRHDHSHLLFAGVKLGVGFSDPVGIIAIGSVQKPESLVFLPAALEF